jgi:OOP family OmpA-OmpF porin
VDSDGDTVADGLDLCPNTPGCAHVDGKGCPKDSDGDGVSDGCDACPTTAAGARVDAAGCTIDADSDGDTVLDSRDRCPGTLRGAKVDENGCELLVSMVLHFASDSAELSSADRALLDRIAHALHADGGNFEVAGHCDATNTDEYNQGLSERRASAVRDYLAAHGVDAGRLLAKGYGESSPVASNDTAEGRAQNRRVEILRR